DAWAGAGAAGRERRAAVVERLPRIGARIERVEAITGPRQVVAALEELQAQLRAVAGRHAGGAEEVGELGEGRLAEDDGAGAAQLFGDERILCRYRSAERDRSGRRRHIGSIDVVLEDDRYAEQWLSAPIIIEIVDVQSAGGVEGVLIHVHEAVELWTGLIVGRDPREIHAHELLGGESAGTKCMLNVGDGGHDQLNRVAVPSLPDARQKERGNEEHPSGQVGAFHVFL